MKRNRINNTIEVIKHYESILGKDDNTILPQIKQLMQSWQVFIKTKSLSASNKAIFLNAIKSENQYISEEACSLLSAASNSFQELRELFETAFFDKKWKSRLNVITFSFNFERDYTKKLLETAINDKNAKVRRKVADVILWGQEKDFLNILIKRLEIEPNKHVMNEINFAIEKFDDVIINNDGSKTLRMGVNNP